MKISLLLLSAMSLVGQGSYGAVRYTRVIFPAWHVCAVASCYLDIQEYALQILNSKRKLKGDPPLVLYANRRCPREAVPKCNASDYK